MQKSFTEFEVLADRHDLIAFARDALQDAGAAHQAATVTAEVLVEADTAGVESHGVSRLKRYLSGLSTGRIDGRARCRVVVDAGSLLVVDGNNGLGPAVFQQATDLAIDKAIASDLSITFVRNSNHMGMTGWFTRRAAFQGLFSIACTNGVPLVAPSNGKNAMFGTNPISFSLSTRSDHVTFDGATGVVSRGKLEQLARSGGTMLDDWVIDTSGTPVTNLEEAIAGLEGGRGCAIHPIGGSTAERGGHKGYGLSLLVELLCGPLAGGPWSLHTHLPDRPAQVGQFMMCLKPDAVGDRAVIDTAVESMLREIREARSATPSNPVRVPGDRRRQTSSFRSANGVPLGAQTAQILMDISRETGIPFKFSTLEKGNRNEI
ncbi:Ldh family oxidoreductase [Nocardia bovistercoris]|uniref:Ldh family oxidoreductase n=1 Tax=Nocardia bovistercoris TaxID=2785916 RepID=A0A931IFQ3_9NOCA|nr:Ldh family oxidoreductase [Nocardia bovistercoris]